MEKHYGGKSPDLAAKEIAEKNFGRVSSLFRKALKTGKPVRIALAELSKQRINPKLGELIDCLLSDYRGFQKLALQLNLSLVNDKKAEQEDLSKKLDIFGNWLVMLPLVAVAILLMDLFNKTLADIPPEAGFDLPSPLFPVVLMIGVLAAAAAALIIILTMLTVRIK